MKERVFCEILKVPIANNHKARFWRSPADVNNTKTHIVLNSHSSSEVQASNTVRTPRHLFSLDFQSLAVKAVDLTGKKKKYQFLADSEVKKKTEMQQSRFWNKGVIDIENCFL